MDRVEPGFVPAALAFGSGIHGAAAFFLRGAQQGKAASLEDVQGYFEGYWALETQHKPIRFGDKDTKESLLDLATRMLAVFVKEQRPEA